MDAAARRIRALMLAQLDRRFDRIRELGQAVAAPDDGWLSAIRGALGMTQGQLASRMGVTQQAVSQLERREADGSVSLRALAEAAASLDSTLVYVIVPRRSIQETLEERALRVARRLVGSVRHAMRLEDQDPGSDLEPRIRELAAELLDTPSQLWSEPLDR